MVFLNGFFVVAEYGLLRARKSKLEELAANGSGSASLVLRALTKQDTYLSAIQLGVTASTVLLGILGGRFFALLLHDAAEMDMVLAWACSILFVVLLHVVIGELVPRAMAASNVEKAAMNTLYPVIFFHYLLYPLNWVSSRASQAVQKLLHIAKPAEDMARSEDELRRIVSASEQEGQIDHIESSMIDNVFDFADRVAREVMVPRQDMVCLYVEDTVAENLEKVRHSRHTRYPLCEEDKDHVLGTIHVRDLVGIDPASADLRKLMRPIVVIPEAMPISKALPLLQQRHEQMVLVADEYGGTAGLITMEDLVEEIVGEIQDEHEAQEPEDVVALPNGVYEFDGMVLLDDITEILGVEFDDPEEDTIGGYVFGLLGRRPEVGDSITLGTYSFKVLQTEGFRVLRLQAVPLPKNAAVKVEEDE
ncbi:hemolysin family protein [Phascolarctobacterium sp.]|uniref:hemolysin family protein n=1 Tax=Phascolarctobacterium sp. TaxID=2049039 RepID=UPI0038654829